MSGESSQTSNEQLDSLGHNNSENDLLSALQSGDFDCAKHAVLDLQDEFDENENIISKALVQAMYLLWIKTTKSNSSEVRHKELAALRLVVTELVGRHGVNPTQGLLTAFHYCMQLGDVKLLKLFFSNGINACHLDSLHNTPLHLACTYSCNPELVQCVLQHDGNTCNVRNAAGMTPLMIAIDKFWGYAAHGKEVWQNSFTTLEILLNLSDIDLNIVDFNQKTPLAIQYERLHSILQCDVLDHVFEICQKMLTLGVDVDVCSSNGETAIHKIFQNIWLNEDYMVKFAKLLLNHPSTNMDATFTRDEEVFTVLTQLFNISVSINNDVQSARYFTLMNDIVLAGANVDALMQKTDDYGRNIFNICLSSMYRGLSDVVQQLMINILANNKSPAVVAAANNKYQNKTPLEHLYPFSTPSLPRLDNFESPYILDIAFGLFRCGASKAEIINILQSKWAVKVPRYQFAKHIGLWYRAGVDMKEFGKVLYFVLQEGIHNNNLKALDCFLREGLSHQVVECAKLLHVDVEYLSDQVPLDVVTKYVNEFHSEPLSLQVCCASVFKDHLQPNAICGVEYLQYKGRFLPDCIKSIILNENLAREINTQVHDWIFNLAKYGIVYG